MDSPLVARVLRFATFASLLTSASVAVVLSEPAWQLWRTTNPPGWAHLVAPACFITCLVIFALDRVVAVRRGNEVAPRAWMQVSAAAFLLCLLAPQELVEMRRAVQRRVRRLAPASGAARAKLPSTPGSPSPFMTLLGHPDETVRVAACELLGTPYIAFAEPPGGAAADEAEGTPQSEHDEGAGSGHHPRAHAAFREQVQALQEQVGALGQHDPSADVRDACGQAYNELTSLLEDELSCPDAAPSGRDYDIL